MKRTTIKLNCFTSSWESSNGKVKRKIPVKICEKDHKKFSASQLIIHCRANYGALKSKIIRVLIFVCEKDHKTLVPVSLLSIVELITEL